MTYAPAALWAVFTRVQSLIPQAQMGGIVPGPAELHYGYHWPVDLLPASDYSRQFALDKSYADADASSALDISLPPQWMETCTARLLAAAHAGDNRLAVVREFAGTTNGAVTHAMDMPSVSESLGQWDDSHLHHIHLSFYRHYQLNTAALLPVADVLAGIAAAGPASASDALVTERIPMDAVIWLVSAADAKAKHVTWPGWFVVGPQHGDLVHIPTSADLNTIRRRWPKMPVQTVSVAEYHAHGGK